MANYILISTASKSRFLVNTDAESGDVDVIMGEIKRGSSKGADGKQVFGWRPFGEDGQQLSDELLSKTEAADLVASAYGRAAEAEAEAEAEETALEAAEMDASDPSWDVIDLSPLHEAAEEFEAELDAEEAADRIAEAVAGGADPDAAIIAEQAGERRAYTARLKADLELPGFGKQPQFVTEHATSPAEARKQAEARGFGPFRGEFKLDAKAEEETRKTAERATAGAPAGRGPRSKVKASGKAAQKLAGLVDLRDLGLDKFTLRSKLERDEALFPELVRDELKALMARRTNAYAKEEAKLIVEHLAATPEDHRRATATDIIDSGAYRRGEPGTLDVAAFHARNAVKKQAAALKALKAHKAGK